MSAEPAVEKPAVLAWLAAVPSLVTLCGTLSLVASVIYDWGYLLALGTGFAVVPTSLVDHARSALLWLPPSGLGLAIGLVMELATRRIEGGKNRG